MLLGVGALVLVLLVVGVVVYQHRTAPQTVPPPVTRSAASIPPSRTPSPSPSAVRPSPPSVIVESKVESTGFAASSAYEIIGYGPSGLIRWRPRDGRMIQTSLPDISVDQNGSAQLSLVARRSFVAILPTDRSAAYVVSDGKTAHQPDGVLNVATFAFPGPDPGSVWVTTTPTDRVPGLDQVSVKLVDGAGRAAGKTLPVPYQGSDYSMVADGTGYVVAIGTGGVYLSRPEGLQRITAGRLLATGPTRWLTHDCDQRGRCSMNVVDRATGLRRGLPGSAPANVISIGQVSPDGRYAAVTTLGGDGGSRLMLLDLATGRQRTASGSVGSAFWSQGMTWTPDGRRLLVIGDRRVLRVVDPGNARSTEAPGEVPPLVAITVRVDPGV